MSTAKQWKHETPGLKAWDFFPIVVSRLGKRKTSSVGSVARMSEANGCELLVLQAQHHDKDSLVL